jgi:hypothetical protein
MSRLDDIFEALHDVILERFRAERGGQVGNALVAFEFGTPIPEDTFRLKDPQRTISPDLAIEFLSQHTDTVPEVRDMLFRRRPYSVAAQYGLMLTGAMPVDGANADMLGAVRQQAAAAYEHTLGSLVGPYRFRPVYATPVNWYDTSDTGSWTHISINRSDTPPARPEGKLKIDPKLRMWRIAPDAVRPVLDQRLSTAVIQQLDVQLPAQPLELTKRSRASLRLEALQPATAPAATVNLSRRAIGVSDLAATRRAGDFGGIRSHAAEIGALRAAAAASTQPAPPPPPAAVSKVGSLLGVNASLHLANAIATDTQQHDVATEQFGITVDICLVNLQRPWLSDAFLNVRGWFVPGFEKGEFSNGDEQEDGPFAILPTACILVRNLQITATWSDADRAVIEQAANLGTFSLFGRSFDRNTATLSVPGMQSIAWVCEPMPLLPPAGAP